MSRQDRLSNAMDNYTCDELEYTVNCVHRRQVQQSIPGPKTNGPTRKSNWTPWVEQALKDLCPYPRSGDLGA